MNTNTSAYLHEVIEDHMRTIAALRNELDTLRAERWELCDTLSEDATTIAGQTLIDVLTAILKERNDLRGIVDVCRSDLRAMTTNYVRVVKERDALRVEVARLMEDRNG